MMSLAGKKILLGITGSIAAYKSIELSRLLIAEGALVQVVMTASALHFVTPLSLQAVSGRPVRTATFDLEAEAAMSHIELARWADLILIAPASAHIIAALAHGLADDLLSTLCIASEAPLYIVPAMNRLMWENKATEANVQILKNREVQFLGPCAGLQACGESGLGRMLEPIEIVQGLALDHSAPLFLKGQRIMITAGPTREALDPVRYLSNYSSGKMGYALAAAALKGGAEVILVSGPVALQPPSGINFYSVLSAQEMYDTVMHHLEGCTLFIGAAAVADYRPLAYTEQKIKKSDVEINIQFVKNPDILATVAALPIKQRPLMVGFAAETQNCLMQGQSKLKNKNLDYIVVNDVSQSDVGFESDNNVVTVLNQDGVVWASEKMSKTQLAYALLKIIAKSK